MLLYGNLYIEFKGILSFLFNLLHPNPQFIASCIDRIGVDGPIEVRQGQRELIFQLQTSAGEVVSLSNSFA